MQHKKRHLPPIPTPANAAGRPMPCTGRPAEICRDGVSDRQTARHYSIPQRCQKTSPRAVVKNHSQYHLHKYLPFGCHRIVFASYFVNIIHKRNNQSSLSYSQIYRLRSENPSPVTIHFTILRPVFRTSPWNRTSLFFRLWPAVRRTRLFHLSFDLVTLSTCVCILLSYFFGCIRIIL